MCLLVFKPSNYRKKRLTNYHGVARDPRTLPLASIHFYTAAVGGVHIATSPEFDAIFTRLARDVNLQRTSSSEHYKLFIYTDLLTRLVDFLR